MQVYLVRGLAILLGLLLSSSVFADSVHIAVASNFHQALKLLAQDFERASGHRVRISSASTGQLYAQVLHGAPYDIVLAADSLRPQRLEQQGLVVSGQRFTYAIGGLVLWAPGLAATTQGCRAALERGQFSRLAIANPATAPYGLAAKQVLQHLGLWQSYRKHLVRGQNIAQTFQFVASANVAAGFVARAQLAQQDKRPGCHWPVPAGYHGVIAQQAVGLKRAANKPAARAFLDYLRSPPAQGRIRDLGYDTP